jgi:preprotein translocase subunit SecE
MDSLNFYLSISISLFLVSLAYILWAKRKDNDKEFKAQFAVTGCLLVIFYGVCFFSGICSILNFLFRWVF